MQDETDPTSSTQEPALEGAPPDVEREPSLVRALLQLALVLAPVIVFAACAWSRRWVDDDGFINLRVVRNILEGYGPVYNAGERVEVYTSALWIGVMALFGKLLPMPLERVATFGGIALAVLGLLFAVLASMRATRSWQGSPGARLDRRVFANDSWTLPLGAAVVAVLPPFWDYASSGLETGLALFWLGGSYVLLFQSLDGGRRRTSWLTSVVFGLGPLLRPEFALYSVAFFLPLAVAEDARARALSRSGYLRILELAGFALAIPLAYQIFRMGYFAALTPNTAIAKEAFRLNVRQGYCYWKNFFGLYALAVPLTCLLVFWITRIRQKVGDGARRLALFTPPIVGMMHAAYVVSMGGDYMHGRMFLPAVFAVVLPVATVTLKAPERSMIRSFVPYVVALPLLVWLPICGLRLRVAVENVCGIGDERGWYARMANVANPVLLDDYCAHHFYTAARSLRDALRDACPSVFGKGPHAPCRTLMLSDTERGVLVPRRTRYPLADVVVPSIEAAVPGKAIGISGYLMPSNVYVVDQLGLGDPVAGRIQLKGRGRPGHEKDLPIAWVVAKLTEPEPSEDASVVAARHAMTCGPLAELDRATRAPLGAGRFFANMGQAMALQKLRIPKDPFEAEERFCHVPQTPRSKIEGGGGGSVYRWQCPKGTFLVGLAGASTANGELSELRAQCASPTDPSTLEGPSIGKTSNDVFRSVCPPGTWMTRLGGTSGRVVQAMTMHCSDGSEHLVTSGASKGTPFDDVACKDGSRPIGVLGRAGDLVDAVGFLCEAPSP